jgi:glycosyltransferase involved in cell wall biosynthesis
MFSLFSQYYRINSNALLYLLIPSYDHPKVIQYLEKYQLPADSYMLEEVAHSEVGKTIGIADAGLLLREEHPVNLVSSPTKFGEYLASGIPVILTDGIGDYSEMANELKVGISVKIENNRLEEQELQRLSVFLTNVQLNRELWADRCKTAANQYLDWNTSGAKLKEIYSRLMAEQTAVS